MVMYQKSHNTSLPLHHANGFGFLRGCERPMKFVLAFSVRSAGNHVHEEKNCCGHQEVRIESAVCGRPKVYSFQSCSPVNLVLVSYDTTR